MELGQEGVRGEEEERVREERVREERVREERERIRCGGRSSHYSDNVMLRSCDSPVM